MIDMMTPLFNESDIVSPELLNVVLVNLLEPAKSIRKNSYELAKELVQKCALAIEPNVQQVC